MAIERVGYKHNAEEGERGREEVGILLVITGLSGSGKNSVVDRLLQEHPTMSRAVSTTTRGPRKDEFGIEETHGEDYYFIGEDEFRKRRENGEFLEWNPYGEHLYGTHIKALSPVLAGQDVILILNPGRVVDLEDHIRQKFDPVTAQTLIDRTISILITTETVEESRERVVGRDGNEQAFTRSIDDNILALEQLKDKEGVHVVVNRRGQVHHAMHDIFDIVKEHKENL